MNENVLARLLKILAEKKVLTAKDVVALTGCSLSNAYSKLMQLHAMYKDKTRYNKGSLELVENFKIEELDPETQVEVLKTTYKMLKEKLQKNHLTHLEKMLLERRLDDALKELEKLKKTIQEEL